MRLSRMQLRNAVHLYKLKGTRLGVEGAVSVLTGWARLSTWAETSCSIRTSPRSNKGLGLGPQEREHRHSAAGTWPPSPPSLALFPYLRVLLSVTQAAATGSWSLSRAPQETSRSGRARSTLATSAPQCRLRRERRWRRRSPIREALAGTPVTRFEYIREAETRAHRHAFRLLIDGCCL